MRTLARGGLERAGKVLKDGRTVVIEVQAGAVHADVGVGLDCRRGSRWTDPGHDLGVVWFY